MDQKTGKETLNPRNIIENEIKGIARKIALCAQQAEGKASLGVDWSEWSTGRIDISNPKSLSELKENYPLLKQFLTFSDTYSAVLGISDKDEVSGISYWRNPDSEYADMKLEIRNSDRKIVGNLVMSIGFGLPQRKWQFSKRTEVGIRGGADERGLLDAAGGISKLFDDLVAENGISKSEFTDQLYEKLK